MNNGYGQFCPVAKASEILATRWTPLILRELMFAAKNALAADGAIVFAADEDGQLYAQASIDLDEAGRELPGSRREVTVVGNVPGWQLALPVIVPLALGLSVWLWRREQVRSARSLSVEQRRRMA